MTLEPTAYVAAFTNLVNFKDLAALNTSFHTSVVRNPTEWTYLPLDPLTLNNNTLQTAAVIDRITSTAMWTWDNSITDLVWQAQYMLDHQNS